jgi:Helicase conserved C-terminal domain
MHNGAMKKYPHDEHFVERFNVRILQKAAGLAPEQSEISLFPPKRMFFSGVLCAARQNETEQEKQERERYRPRSCGLDFIVSADAKGDLGLRFSFYVFAVAYQRFETLTPQPAPMTDYVPTLAHLRFPVSVEGRVALSDLTPGIRSLTLVSGEINSVLDGVTAQVSSNPDALRDRHAGGTKPLPLRHWTEEAYHTALRQGDPVKQTWKADVLIMVSDTEAGRRVQVFLQNESEETDTTFALDRNFYGAELSVKVDPGILKEIPLERSPLNDYRYGRTVIVQGINCNSVHDDSGLLATCFTPTFEQTRYLPDDKTYDLSFARVRTESDKIFDEIDAGLATYEREWKSKIKIGDLGIKSVEDLRIAQGFFESFQLEAERVREGMALIRKEPLAKTAFLLMNRVFERIARIRSERGERAMKGWFLFQFCFMLTLFPAFVNRNAASAKEAYLLWFPTGGGKTEAVMGVVVFAMFYERLAGRKYGLTSWMRFPLRLLTFQQMQRYTNVIIAADGVRAEAVSDYPSLKEGAFTLGYFGGRNNSPNDLQVIRDDIDVPYPLRRKIKDRLQAQGLTRQPTAMDVLLDDEGKRIFQEHRLIADCFYCGGDNTIEIVGDPVALALRHRCKECEAVLPVFTTDEDIYTQLPTVIVGTLDKLATIGFRSAFRTLIGKSDGTCMKHGFGTFGKCLKAGYGRCNHSDWTPRRSNEAPYGGISILFLDELHLIKEQLGCFDAHYESLLISLCTESGGKAPLVVAASATIEGADHQIDHLYEARTIRFPGEGPNLRDTFYARETPDLQRVFVGIKPSNLAHLNTAMSLTTFIFEEISWLRNERRRMEAYYPGLSSLSDAEYQDLIDRHTLTVAYVNSKREGENIRRSVEEQVRDHLRREGCDEPYNVTSLTGDTTMDDVKSALRRMDTKRFDLPDGEKLDYAVATSMISHGVDVDRLNTMIFFSYPRSTAEYIQASSRAGRTYPGIVYIVLKSTTYRDRSFYRNFREVHEALDKMVEAVPIDRFAVHAVERTVPGLAIGTLLNRAVDRLPKGALSLDDARNLDNVQTLKRLVIQGLHFKDVVQGDLNAFYQVSDSRAADWRAEIPRLLDKLDTMLSGVGPSWSITKELDFTETRVMKSLRDVDPPLEVLIHQRISTDRGGDDDE